MNKHLCVKRFVNGAEMKLFLLCFFQERKYVSNLWTQPETDATECKTHS